MDPATAPPHPGKIKIVELFDDSVKVVPVDDLSPEQQFAYYTADGIETRDAEDAVERVPVVEIHVLSFDAEGEPVKPDEAETLRITEFGPDERRLRSTTLKSE